MMLWLARRIAISIGLVWIVASIVFLTIRMIPGNPAEMLLSQGGVAPDPASVAELKRQLGLDRPLLAQYAASMIGLVEGNLGDSLQDGSPVMGDILARLPRTLELIAAAGLFAVLVGVPAGALAAIRSGGFYDRVGSWLAGLWLSVPIFVTGTLLILLFAQTLRWLPAGGYVPFA
ncbi:MAG TPA: ABC transporter permease, partial [Acetobacteraceae bacterium]|nr:ABC transporter permease [Acetobacteraceae bacterium]